MIKKCKTLVYHKSISNLACQEDGKGAFCVCVNLQKVNYWSSQGSNFPGRLRGVSRKVRSGSTRCTDFFSFKFWLEKSPTVLNALGEAGADI